MLTARDLLYKALDYDGFWNTSKKMLVSRPAQIRLLQLEWLLAAFGISKLNARVNPGTKNGHYIDEVYFSSIRAKRMNRTEYLKSLTTFQYLTTGEFISDASEERYRALVGQIVSTSKSIFPEQSENIDKEPIHLVYLFRDLYQFRLHLYHMTKYDFSRKRMKLFSTEDNYALYLRNTFIGSMNASLSEIDEILCTLIDPERKSLKEDEINYPNADLKTIDEEWENEIR